MIQKVPINKIRNNPDNPRFIKDEKFKKLFQSIKDFPEMMDLRPIVVDSNLMVLGGNMRLKACREAGFTEVPIIIADQLTEAQRKEFIIKDNSSFGEWDWNELQENWNFDELEEWGLDIPDHFNAQAIEVVEDDFEANADEVQTDIVEGDVLEIGPHRLVCGDSTNPDIVKKALNGATPYLMVTDPPYGIEYDASWRDETGKGGHAKGKVLNDDRADWSDAWSLSPAKVAYVYHAASFTNVVRKSLEDNAFIFRSLLIWKKNHHALIRSDYQHIFEPILYCVKKNATAKWIGDRKQTTVWEIDKNRKNETGHSTQKPVECMAKPIRNHDGDVYEPFCGSGSTMVAAHQLGRKCYAIELSPPYCQIIIDRMRASFPELEIKKNSVII